MNKRKRKMQNGVDVASKRPKADPKEPKEKTERCTVCKQNLQGVVMFNGTYNGSVEEFVALTDEKLMLFTGNENSIHESDEIPTEKLTHYSVYDEKGHLCSFDTGLIEKNVILHLSGYIKRIDEEDSSINNGIPAHDIGPINEWFITGFDGGQKALLGIVTSYAQYILMEPAAEYCPFVKTLTHKVELLKLIVEYLLDHAWEDPTYEDLFSYLESSRGSEFSEDFLLQHTEFICDQIHSFDQAGAEDDKPLITTPCVRDLVKMTGVTFRKRKQMRMTGAQKILKKTGFVKATTTELVRSVFENFFPDQIEVLDVKGPKKKRCGVCDVCQSPDCGKCTNCKDMVKFGGSGKSKQACKQRRCPNMAVQDAEESENENDNQEDETGDLQIGKRKKVVCAKRNVNNVEWVGESLLEIKGRKFYGEAVVGNITIKRGDFVLLNPENPNEPLYIGKVEYMYEQMLKGQIVHANIFYRGNETILGETADPQELFVADICEDAPLGSIIRKAEVNFRKAPENWTELGGVEVPPPRYDEDEHSFFFSKKYKTRGSTFVDYIPQWNYEENENVNICNCCMRKRLEDTINKPLFNGNTIMWMETVYKVGSAVFLDPSIYKFNKTIINIEEKELRSVDESIYTEYYRKNSDIKGSNLDTSEPFIIGLIEDILEKGGDLKISVRILYRPENTKSGYFLAHQKDINLLFWTEEMVKTTFDKVAGKCYVRYYDELENPSDWCEDGPYRFYFTECYNVKGCEIGEVPALARKIGYGGKKGKGKSKGKSKSSKVENEPDVLPDWGRIERPLRCMDVFAGCGGLSEGLHQAGIAETKWAIEREAAAAHAFELNNPDTKMYIGDCNDLLRDIISGEGSHKGLPSKGDVEMLVGGPPCQGFSGMNRFNAGQYSLFKNSLVVTYLSYCEYYRPKYFILENVRNFVSFKRSMVLKLTLRCLLAMGYQVTFGVLQAGHYGVPQTRRRLILIAAAPGYVLPKLPEPQYVFNRRGCHLSFALDGVKYTNGNFWTESAPYRTICVRDALSDLPDISNGWSQTEMPYDDEATSHFQRKMRKGGSDTHVIDHVCKEMAPIVQARIAHIPENPGSDWRDLPNIVAKLSDGTESAKLQYPYRLKKQNPNEPPRGVCQCAIGKSCTNEDRQLNTLIPWCLPHTADRHNHWAGLYGRLEWDGFFGTTITNPEPMGKQGRVLHPDQNRVVSVRECARSQGFPDRFKFYGNVLDKHRQVGNAVPPPLGKAIGLEIRKALSIC